MRKKEIKLLVTCAVLLLLGWMGNANENVRFTHLELPNGINSTVKCILEDSEGFMWFGTANGLVVYDAYRFRRVDFVANEGTGSFGSINALAEDHKHQIWIGTESGVFIHDKHSETSKRIDDEYLTGIQCRSLYISASNEVLIGTSRGLYIYNQEGEFLERFLHQSEMSAGLSHNVVRSFYEDTQKRLWIGTFDGLNCLDRKKGVVTKYFLKKEARSSKKNNLILSIQPLSTDSDSIFLVGTETGLCIFNTLNGEFKQFQHREKVNSISNDIVKTIWVNGETIWLGTDLGLNLFTISEQKFYNYYHDYLNTYSISNNVVHQVYIDRQNNLWLATDNGIDKMYLRGNNVLYNKLYDDSKTLKGEINITGLSGGNDNVWFSTREGLIKYNHPKNEYKYFLPPELLHNKVGDVLCDNDGMVWISTAGGLNTLDVNRGTVESFVADESNAKALQSNYIHVVAKSNSGVWIGSYDKGLHKAVVTQTGELEFYNFRYSPDNANTINSDRVTDIVVDKNDNVWVATNKGLNRIDELRGVVKRYTIIQNGNNQYVSDLFVDSNNTLWLSTFHGLYYSSVDTVNFKKIEDIDLDIQSLVVKDSIVYMASGNDLFYYDLKKKALLRIPKADLGMQSILNVEIIQDSKLVLYGKEGFVALNIGDIEIDNQIPQVNWTNFSILGEDVKPYVMRENRYVLTERINDTRHIELKYSENTFRIDFSSLQYSHGSDSRYRYMLEGYEDAWRITRPNQAYVSYTQVRPGKYKLKVKASNKYGLFDDEWREIDINIKPPLYLSRWALVLYVIVLVGLFILSRKLLIAREKANSDIRWQTLQRQKSEELIEVKTRFFTNISHELKTPLTLISSPIDDLLEQDPEEPLKSSLLLVKRNTDRLKKLVNQILDIRKIEKGGEKLTIQEYDIIRFCDRIISQFKQEAERRNMLLQYNTVESSLMMWFDMEKMEKVLVNLLSNAFKFTPDGGFIRVEVKDGRKLSGKANEVLIAITDDGCGISKHAQNDVFDRFNTQVSPNYSNQQGTGIGLSLVKEYVTMHGGTIGLQSEPDNGSCFTFSIPLDKNKFVKFEEEIAADVQSETHESSSMIEEDTEQDLEPETAKMVILVVEDDNDMRDYIVSGLKEHYKVLSAENGVEGQKIALKEVPDIIISDWMMPKMNGIELCDKLKNDLRTCHIPFILLTAKGGLESQTEGIATGADDYIQKPFSMAYLQVRIKNLWQQRERLKKAYQSQTKLEPSEVTVTSMDEKFLADLMELLEKDMDNPELNVKSLSEKIGMSHTNLYRKIKALTGQTATEFIRTIRLKRAAQLLKSGQLNVSEVMYMVGFSHRSYFTQSFKAMYGVSPKEYK